MAGVRQAIDRDNEQRRAQGQPEVPAEGLVSLAESLLPRLGDAEWHDRADAALASIDDLDLRDLRSVVVAADDHAKDEQTRALAAELRTKLTERVDRCPARMARRPRPCPRQEARRACDQAQLTSAEGRVAVAHAPRRSDRRGDERHAQRGRRIGSLGRGDRRGRRSRRCAAACNPLRCLLIRAPS